MLRTIIWHDRRIAMPYIGDALKRGIPLPVGGKSQPTCFSIGKGRR